MKQEHRERIDAAATALIQALHDAYEAHSEDLMSLEELLTESVAPDNLLMLRSQMNTPPWVRGVAVTVTDEDVDVLLEDGRRVLFPIRHSRLLSEGSAAQRNNHELISGGWGIHWPDLDEDFSITGMLRTIPFGPLDESKDRSETNVKP